MDQVSTTSDDVVIGAKLNSESDTPTRPFSLFNDSGPKCQREAENKKIIQHSSLEMDRTCIRPMNTDDIISKELPFEILDTDFDGKDEDSIFSPTESRVLNVPDCSLRERRESIDDESRQPRTKSSDEQFKADIIEQDTGYSSDAGENVKSTSSESIDLVEAKLDEEVNQLTSSADGSTEPEISSVTNHVDVKAYETDIVSNTDSQSSLVSEQENTNSGDFVPTIVGIRGAYDSSTSNETNADSNSKEVEEQISSDTSLQQINIVNVQGSCQKAVESIEDNSNLEEVYIVDASDETDKAENRYLTSSFNTDLDIKQEPPEIVDSSTCTYDNTQNEDRRFTSEIFIEEEKTQDKEEEVAEEEEEEEEEEVICIESLGKIPLPIPIKTEAHVDGGEQNITSHSATSSKESNLSETLIRSLPVVKNAAVFSTAGYTCHLCKTTFQEYELLNDHMALHRNNLVDPNKMKQKAKSMCPICHRQLKTLQSLQQHIKIHHEEKPLVCSICSKAFGHQSNYKTHMQKHEMERARKAAARKNVPLAPRIVERQKPLNFSYQTQTTNQACRTNALKPSFSTSATFRRDNAKENVNLLYRSFTYRNRGGGEMITRTRIVDDLDDDVIPLKTFSNVENIVMNAARFIVKVDSIDPNVLKRRIKTPDISIDKNAITTSKRCGEKRKVILSPTDNSKRLKLDQIENIIMENETEFDQTSMDDVVGQDDDQDYDYGDDFGDCDYDTMTEASLASETEVRTGDKSTENLLADEVNAAATSTEQNDYVSELRRNAQMILKSEAEKWKNSRSNSSSSSSSSSNVIMLKNAPSRRRSPSPITSTSSFVSEAPYESYTNESSDEEISVSDSFDKAFHRVALRRLRLIQKRAANNNGKIESKYRLGPLFWRKALRRAKLNSIDFDVNAFPDSTTLSQSPDPATYFGKSSKLDERRTNDPKRLQIRAESKLSFMLDKIRLTNSMNDTNLIGPLFWKRTLQLAGIRRPQDLPSLLDKEQLSLQDVEFVDDALSFSWKNKEDSGRAAAEAADSATSQVLRANSNVVDVKRSSDLATDCDSSNQNSTLVDSILSDVVLQQPATSQSNEIEATKEASNVSTMPAKSNSILYNSLTKPRTKSSSYESAVSSDVKDNIGEEGNASPKSVPNGSISSTVVVDSSPENVDDENANTTSDVVPVVPAVVDGDAEMVDANAAPDVAADKIANSEANENGESAAMEVDPSIGNANIVLNVDENFQLITSNGDKLGELTDGTNYVLVSDETGAMQLVKENDLRLVESGDASGDAQYVVNFQGGENYSNLELMDQVNGGEQQLSYALQFDGENYTAIQLVQNADVASGEEKVLKAAVNVSDDAVTLKSADVGETATGLVLPTTTTADLNSIGKELSDFLNLNYDALNEK